MMNYKIISDDYANIGGNYRIVVVNAWIPAENRQLTVAVSNEDYLIQTCDTFLNNIESTKDMLVCAGTLLEFNEDKKSMKYRKLIIECIRLLAVHIGKVSVGYDLLPDNIQALITDDMRQLADDEDNGLFEVAYDKVWLNVAYDAKIYVPYVCDVQYADAISVLAYLTSLTTLASEDIDAINEEALQINVEVGPYNFKTQADAASITGLISAVQYYIDQQ